MTLLLLRWCRQFDPICFRITVLKGLASCDRTHDQPGPVISDSRGPEELEYLDTEHSRTWSMQCEPGIVTRPTIALCATFEGLHSWAELLQALHKYDSSAIACNTFIIA